MNVLLLFDGISCAQIALNRCNINYSLYLASEFDKYAIDVTQANYPNTIQLGNVKFVDSKNLPKIDFLFGGSPCQGFSLAGKRLNFNDPRSKLFFEYVRLLEETNPRYFIFENVPMKKEIENEISRVLNVNPIIINSNLVSAQNRIRLYWTNISNVRQPEDKNIYLKDIIQKNLRNKKYYVNLDTFCGGILKAREKREKLNLVHMFKRPHGWDNAGFMYRKKTYTIISSSKNNSVFLDNGIWRRFTPVEFERLQTVPDNYTNYASDNQRYKMLANCWTVDVISHLLNFYKMEVFENKNLKTI